MSETKNLETTEVTLDSVDAKIKKTSEDLKTLKNSISADTKLEENKAKEIEDALLSIQQDLNLLGVNWGAEVRREYHDLYNDYAEIVENPNPELKLLTYNYEYTETSTNNTSASTETSTAQGETTETVAESVAEQEPEAEPEQESEAEPEQEPEQDPEQKPEQDPDPESDQENSDDSNDSTTPETPAKENTNSDNWVPAEVQNDDKPNWFKRQRGKLKSKEEWKQHTLRNLARAACGVWAIWWLIWLWKKIFSRADWESRIPWYKDMSRKEKRQARRKWRRENR